jgi:hypothetical protein
MWSSVMIVGDRPRFEADITWSQKRYRLNISDHIGLIISFNPLKVEAEAYCQQTVGTVIPSIEPRWDPWP